MIDTDLGISGQWGVAREGFTELVTKVCSGDVGAIFGIEITRLARSEATALSYSERGRNRTLMPGRADHPGRGAAGRRPAPAGTVTWLAVLRLAQGFSRPRATACSAT